MIRWNVFLFSCAVSATVSISHGELHNSFVLSDFQRKSLPTVSLNTLTSPSLLRLRGGGLFDFFGKCCSCLNFCGGDVPANDDAGGEKKKRRVGRMAGSSEINANIKKIYTVISDVEHYKDWSGNGISTIKILEAGHSHVVAEYVCGSFGFSFHFSMFWALSCPDKITFRNVAPAGMIHMLKGEYTLTERGPNLTNVHFVVIADTRGPIPHIIKLAIAKILVHIAINDLKKYVESPQCDANLKRYEAGLTLGQRLTRLTRICTDVPHLVLRNNFARLALEALRGAAAVLLVRRAMA